VKMVFLPSQCMKTILTTPITQNALCPDQKLLLKVTTSHPGVKKIYDSVVQVINNLMMQILMKNTMTTNGEQGKSIKTNIAEVHASRVSCFPLDDIEFFK
jgi:hypothetical protein